jgi:signal peptidase I
LRDKYIPVYYKSDDFAPIANYMTVTAREYAVALDPNSRGTSSMPTEGEYKPMESLTPMERDLEKFLINAPAAPVPPGYYIMLGDNRNRSYDSRAWGLVPRASIVGRSEAIWFPVSRWRITR